MMVGVHDASLPQFQSLGLQVGVDLRQKALPQAVLLQQMTEVEDGGLVGQGARELQPREPPHWLGLVEQVLHAWVAEIVEELDAVDSQHDGQRIGMASPSRLGVEETESVLQQLPWNQAVHTLQEKFQEKFPAGLALLALVFQIGKGWLVHTTSFPVSIRLFSLTMPHRRRPVQSIPKFDYDI